MNRSINLKMEENIIPIQRISSDVLVQKIEMIWTSKEDLTNLLSRIVPLLQKEVKTAFRTVLKPYAKLKNIAN